MVDSLKINGHKTAVETKDKNAKILVGTTINTIEVFLDSTQNYTYQLIDNDPKPQVAVFPYIRYTNLDGGEYTLKIWNENQTEKQLQISIKRSFWQEWWFWPLVALYVILLGGIIIYLFFLYDFRQKLKLQYMRNSIASDLHDEVGSNLNSIAIFVDLLRKNAPKELLPLLDKITANATESVNLMQDTVWAINPKNDSIELLLDRISSFAFDILAAKSIELVVDKQLKISKLSFTMEQRKNGYLIVKEAINNVAKHSQATQAQLCFIQHSSGLEIRVEDNGVGFDTQLFSTGNGLYNFEQRASEVGIRLELHSAKGEGTSVAIFIDA